MSSQATKVFADAAKAVGFTGADFRFVRLCDPIPKMFKGSDSRTWGCIEPHLERVHAQVAALEPECVVTLGKLAARAYLGRSVEITKARGSLVEHDGRRVFPMFGPGMVMAAPHNEPAFNADLAGLFRLREAGWDESVAQASLGGDYRYVDDLQFLIDMAPRCLSVDTEGWNRNWMNGGTALRPQDPHTSVLTVQLCWAPGKAVAVPIDLWETVFPGNKNRSKVYWQLKQLLGDPSIRKVGQNAKYDHRILLNVLKIKVRGWTHDSLMLSHYLDEDMQRRSQDDLVRRWLPKYAGYADCVTPDTDVLTADLRHMPAGLLRVGDELCAFDEEGDGRKAARRKMRVSVVEGVQRLTRPCLRITTESGRRTVVSTGHLFLSKKHHGDKGGGWRWRRADELNIGSILKPFVWERALYDYDAGYAAGILDGEGWACTGQHRVGIAQKRGVVLDSFKAIMEEKGCSWGHSSDKRKDVVNVTFDGHMAMKVLQMFRPLRLIEKRNWIGTCLPTNGIVHDRVVMIEDVGECSVIGLQTSTKTIIADGLCSHNSFNRETDKSRMDLVDPQKLLVYGCLTHDSLVQLGDGSWRKIGLLVRDKYAGTVRAMIDGRVVERPVTGWYRQDVRQKEWHQIEYASTPKGRWGLRGPAFTPDHQMLTDRGYVRVDALVPGDRVLVGERAFSDAQVSVILGSALGDGGFRRRNDAGVGFGMSQCVRRSGYVDWKASALAPNVVSHRTVEDGAVRHQFAHARQFAEMAAAYPVNEEHARRKLRATPDVLARLGALGLAVWYQDDGTLVRDRDGNAYCSRIYAHLPAADAVAVVGWLTAMLGSGVSYHDRGDNRFVKILGPAFDAFHGVVGPWMHPDMAYKSTYPVESVPVVPSGTTAYGDPVISVRPYPGVHRAGMGVRYCLTVEEAHNFLTEAGVAKNCGDVDTNYQLVGVLAKLLRADQAAWRGYNMISMPGIVSFAEMEQTGMLVAKDRLREFTAEIATQVEEEYQWLISHAPPAIKVRHLETAVRKKLDSLKSDKAKARWEESIRADERKVLSFTRKDFVKDILFDREGFGLKPIVWTKSTADLFDEDEDFDEREASTSAKLHMPYFFGHPKHGDYVKRLAAYQKLVKLLTTYLGEEHCSDRSKKARFGKPTGIWQYIGEDSYIHPSFLLWVTNTGRTNSRDPNGQNFPSRGDIAKRYMRMFVAPEGYRVIAADLSQMELRLVAWFSGDPVMMRIYLEGGDIHTYTAKKILKLSDSEWDALDKDKKKLFRTQAKAVNFGYVYGMSWRKFLAFAFTEYGVKLTEKEAEEWQENYFETYPGLRPWHDAVKAIAARDGGIRCMDGAFRHLPILKGVDQSRMNDEEKDFLRRKVGDAQRQAINAPVQRLGSQFGVAAMRRLVSQNQGDWLKPVAFVHDAIYAYVKIGREREGIDALVYAMQTVPMEKWFGKHAVPPVPIIAEPDVGVSFGEKIELGDWRGKSLEQMKAAGAKIPDWFATLQTEQDVTGFTGDKPTWWRDELDDVGVEAMWMGEGYTKEGLPLAA